MRYETPELLAVDAAAAIILGSERFVNDNGSNPPTYIDPELELGLD